MLLASPRDPETASTCCVLLVNSGGLSSCYRYADKTHTTMKKRKVVERDREFIKASAKLFEVLEFYAAHDKQDPISLSQLSSHLGHPKTTLHRLIYSLEKLGYLEKEKAGDAYSLGLRFFALVDRKVSYQRLKTVARPVMEDLASSIQETVNLGVLDQDETVLIEVVEGPNPFRWVSKPGERQMFEATALGKAITAFLPSAEVEQFLRRKDTTRLTPHTITDPRHFLNDLASVRKSLVAIDDEETVSGIQCVASPIFDRTSTVVAALSISGPKIRMAQQLNSAKSAAHEAAQKISHLMGYSIEKSTTAP
jgi:IclR family transcriptional regulator, KDG regulon repressor